MFAAAKPCNTSEHPVFIQDCHCNGCGTETPEPPETLHTALARTIQHPHSSFLQYQCRKSLIKIKHLPMFSDPTHKQATFLFFFSKWFANPLSLFFPERPWFAGNLLLNLLVTSAIFPTNQKAWFPSLVRLFRVVASTKPLLSLSHLRKISKNCSNSFAQPTALELG